MWTLLGKWSELAVPSLPLPQPTQEQEAPEESTISNTLTLSAGTRLGRGRHGLGDPHEQRDEQHTDKAEADEEGDDADHVSPLFRRRRGSG